MATLKIISAGAAQSVVQQVARSFEAQGHKVVATFGAVGAQRAKVLSGDAVDVVILTRHMVDGLAESGQVVRGTQVSLGSVGLGVAVKAGTQKPDIASEEHFRANLCAARALFMPDTQLSTAGVQLSKIMQELGIGSEMSNRLRTYPNGNAAMNALAQTDGVLQLGATMITEIKMVAGIDYVGPLPGRLQSSTTYAAGMASRAADMLLAQEFIARLAGPAARGMLEDAGFLR